MRPYKKTTVYLDQEHYLALKRKAAQTGKTFSELVNLAIRESMAEDLQDLTAFDERENEPDLDFQDVMKDLKGLL